jgi:hypothetical protein
MSRYRFSLHDVAVDTLFNDPAAIDPVISLFHHLGFAGCDMPGRERIAVRLTFGTRTARVRVPHTAHVSAEHDGIKAWSYGDEYFFTCEGHRVRVSPSEGWAQCELPALPGRPRKDVLLFTFLLLLRRNGFFSLHASGVARRQDGVLFVGPCGSTKSTQAFNLVRHGWKYLGDDTILLRGGVGGVEALALRRDLCLDPALVDVIPELAKWGRSGEFAARGKRQLPMHEMFAKQLIDRAAPRLLVFPRICSTSRSKIAPMSQAEALEQLVRQSGVFALDRPAAPAHVRLLSRLVQQTVNMRLDVGRDLRDDPAAVPALIGSVLTPEPSSEAMGG